MTKDSIRDAIIKKQDELIDILDAYSYYKSDIDVQAMRDEIKVERLQSELASLKAELEKKKENDKPEFPLSDPEMFAREDNGAISYR